MRRAPGHVTLVEHGLWQGERGRAALDAGDLAVLAERLLGAGLRDLLVGAVDRRDADAACRVLEPLPRRPDVRYGVRLDDPAAVECALLAGADDLTVTAACSDATARRLHGGDVEDGLRRLEPAARLAAEHGVRLRGQCVDALAGPDGEPVPSALTARLCAELVNLGCFEIGLGDAAGAGDALAWRAAWEDCAARVGADRLAVRLRADVPGALTCLDVLLPLGLQTVDTAVGGLGPDGLPATEDVVAHLHGRDVATGADAAWLNDTAAWLGARLAAAPARRHGAG